MSRYVLDMDDILRRYEIQGRGIEEGKRREMKGEAVTIIL
jgi:hypothetical protein